MSCNLVIQVARSIGDEEYVRSELEKYLELSGIDKRKHIKRYHPEWLPDTEKVIERKRKRSRISTR